jgi:molecular chaperone HtpG
VTGDGGGARRWREIEQLRSEAGIEVPVRHFLADLQTRFLIGEFIRARHHLRAADVITQHGDHLGGVSFNDPALQQTIADVCVAHGLRQHELEDRTKYPDRRDIRGEQVNVRLLAILLRLGDLLDMNSDRACPLLLNAACPLPADSLAHWTQYQRISHKMVAPDRIELRAECQNQEEHMFLQDWCQWLVQETRNAAVLVGRCYRHAEWKPPFADMDSEQKSIEIVPAVGARYFPSRWTFELDRDLILERFVQNVHERKEGFIRELLQNAFDANRCKMYLALAAEKLPRPESPTKVDEAWRDASVKAAFATKCGALSTYTRCSPPLKRRSRSLSCCRSAIDVSSARPRPLPRSHRHGSGL